MTAVAGQLRAVDTLTYRETPADRRPLPRSYFDERRYEGYAAEDLVQPYARFFDPKLRPLQPHVRDALAAGLAASGGYPPEEVGARLAAPGCEPLETGWAFLADGAAMVSVRTDMPGVTAAMWDWWFGWHGAETARYKLWHPQAHRFVAMGEDRAAAPGLSDRARYVGNVSYVDEFIGPQLVRLAIRFFDPALAGFRDVPGTTVIAGRVGSSEIPVATGWLFHQVRPTARGSEMRSRFFLGYPQILDLPVAASAKRLPTALLGSALGRRLLAGRVAAQVRRFVTDDTARNLLEHCAAEMNHLAFVLPALYREFGDHRESRDG